MKAAFQWDDRSASTTSLLTTSVPCATPRTPIARTSLQPRVLMAARHEKFDREIMNEMGALGPARLAPSKATAAPA